MINTADSTSHHVRESIAILWDIENVTPSTDSLFVRGLLDYAADLGTLSIARAYGDWTRSGIRYTAEVLADNSFEMIHIPKSKKNSACSPGCPENGIYPPPPKQSSIEVSAPE